jgi:general secretion pathway protein H
MGARSQRHSGTAGFTLIELLCVLAIIALVAGISVATFGRPADRVRLETAAHHVAEALRLSRAAAVMRNAPVALTIDADRRTFVSAAISPQRIDADIAIRLTIAEPERLGPARGGFRFFPDGSSTGGEVLLALGGREARICVNWLSGEARQAARC